jgi:hypothetical protein
VPQQQSHLFFWVLLAFAPHHLLEKQINRI